MNGVCALPAATSACKGLTAAPAAEPLPRGTPTRRSEHQDLPGTTICANLHEKVALKSSNERPNEGFCFRKKKTVSRLLNRHRGLLHPQNSPIVVDMLLVLRFVFSSQVLQRLERNEAAYAGFEGIDVPGASRDVLRFLRDYQVRVGEHETSRSLAQQIRRVEGTRG